MIGVSGLSASSILCPGHSLFLSSLETWMLDHYYFVGTLGAQNGIISFSNYLSTSAATSFIKKNASIHPENVSTSPKRYLKLPSTLCMTVKSVCQAYPGYVPLVSIGLTWGLLAVCVCWGGGCLMLELVIIQMKHVSTMRLIVLFMTGATMTSAISSLVKDSLPISSLMNFLNSLISHSLGKEPWPIYTV